MKTKVVQHVPRINISRWHLTLDIGHMSLLSKDMTTKVVQQVPRINISTWHTWQTLNLTGTQHWLTFFSAFFGRFRTFINLFSVVSLFNWIWSLQGVVALPPVRISGGRVAKTKKTLERVWEKTNISKIEVGLEWEQFVLVLQGDPKKLSTLGKPNFRHFVFRKLLFY